MEQRSNKAMELWSKKGKLIPASTSYTECNCGNDGEINKIRETVVKHMSKMRMKLPVTELYGEKHALKAPLF